MAFDANLKLFDGAVNRALNTVVYPDANKNAWTTDGGNSLNIGRGGLPIGKSQFVVGIDNPSNTGTPTTCVVECILQMSLDNGTTYRTISIIDLGNTDEGYQGQIAQSIGVDLSLQEYADANIELRLKFNPTGSNTQQNTVADKLYAFIAYGETTKWGLKSGSNLFQD